MMGLSPSRPPPSVQINVNYHNTRTHSQISTAISLCSVQCFVHYPQLRDTVCGNKCCCLMFLNGNFEHHSQIHSHFYMFYNFGELALYDYRSGPFSTLNHLHFEILNAEECNHNQTSSLENIWSKESGNLSSTDSWLTALVQ